MAPKTDLRKKKESLSQSLLNIAGASSRMFGGGSGWLPASAGSHNSFSIVRHVSFQQEATKGIEQAILNRDLGDEHSVVHEAPEDDESGSEKSDKTSSSGEDSDSSIEAAINGGENEDQLY